MSQRLEVVASDAKSAEAVLVNSVREGGLRIMSRDFQSQGNVMLLERLKPFIRLDKLRSAGAKSDRSNF